MKIKVIATDNPAAAVEGINSFLSGEDVIPYSLSVTEIGESYLLTLGYESGHNFRKGKVRMATVSKSRIGVSELEKKLRALFKPSRGMELICHDLFSSGQSLYAVILELQLA